MKHEKGVLVGFVTSGSNAGSRDPCYLQQQGVAIHPVPSSLKDYLGVQHSAEEGKCSGQPFYAYICVAAGSISSSHQ